MKKSKLIVGLVSLSLFASALPIGTTIANDNTLIFEAENYLSENSGFKLSTGTDGNTMLAGVSKVSSTVQSYIMGINVDTAGDYILQVSAAALSDGIATNYSDVTWSLNGSDPLSLNSSCDKIALDIEGSPKRTLFTYEEKVSLTTGANTIVFSGGKRSGSPMVTFYIDYVKFTPDGEPIIKPTPVPTATPTPVPTTTPTLVPTITPKPTNPPIIKGNRLEIEDFSNEYIVEDANTSGGSFQVYKTTDTNEVVQSLTGIVPKDDMYTITICCADYSNLVFLSQLYLSINGGEYIEVNTDKFYSSSADALATESLQGTFGLYKYELKDLVQLTAGTVTFDIKSIARINTSAGEGKFFSLDYIEFTPYVEPEEVIGHGKLEAEDVSSIGITNDKNVSGGKFQIFKTSATDDVIERFNFEIEENGEYTVNIACACFSVMSYLSPLYISINGEKYIELNANNCTITQLPELADTGIRNTYNLYSITYKNDISLIKGITTIDLKATCRTNTAASPGVYFALDYIEVLPVKEMKGLYANVPNGFIEYGKDVELEIFNFEGKQLTKADINKAVYTVSDERVLSIDNDGIIHGRNYGKATITGTLERKGVKASFTYDACVTGNTGVRITSVKKEGSQLSMTLFADKDDASGHKVFIVVYGNTNGLKTSIKKVYNLDAGVIFANTPITLKQDIELEIGDSVNVYLLNSNNRIVWSKE